MPKKFATEPHNDDLILWLWIETGIITTIPEDDYALYQLESESNSETCQ